MEELITIEEAMKILKVSRITLYRWVKSGKIKSLKLGEGKKGSVRFRREDIEAFLHNSENI